jgi:hypothetical protein
VYKPATLQQPGIGELQANPGLGLFKTQLAQAEKLRKAFEF